MNEFQKDLIDNWGFCTPCLANINASALIQVQYKRDDGTEWRDQAPTPTLPDLLDWVWRQYVEERRTQFSINAMPNAFIPVAIASGTPVCAGHAMADVREVNNGRSARYHRGR